MKNHYKFVVPHSSETAQPIELIFLRMIFLVGRWYLKYKKQDQKLSRSASGQSGPIKYEINFWLKGPCKRFEVEHILCV